MTKTERADLIDTLAGVRWHLRALYLRTNASPEELRGAILTAEDAVCQALRMLDNCNNEGGRRYG